jgi:hypothetical protein
MVCLLKWCIPEQMWPFDAVLHSLPLFHPHFIPIKNPSRYPYTVAYLSNYPYPRGFWLNLMVNQWRVYLIVNWAQSSLIRKLSGTLIGFLWVSHIALLSPLWLHLVQPHSATPTEDFDHSHRKQQKVPTWLALAIRIRRQIPAAQAARPELQPTCSYISGVQDKSQPAGLLPRLTHIYLQPSGILCNTRTEMVAIPVPPVQQTYWTLKLDMGDSELKMRYIH